MHSTWREAQRGAPTLDVLVSRILWVVVDFEVLASDSLRLHLRTVEPATRICWS